MRILLVQRGIEFRDSSFATLPEVDKNAVVASMTTSTPYLLKDTRDNQTYTVAKLADGKVWMLDNLNLDLTDSTVVNKLSQYNTNATNTIISYLKNGGRANGDQYPTAGLPTGESDYTDENGNWISYNSYSMPLVNISGACSTSSSSPCSYDGSYTHNSILSTLSANSVFGNGSGRIGVYYNYCAATAGSYCYGDSGSDYGTPSGNAIYDICPNSWRLPTGGPAGEYQALCTVINKSDCTNNMSIDANDVNSLQYQLSMPLSGLFGNRIALSQGLYGSFWASTYYADRSMRTLTSGASDLIPQNANARTSGISIRCILN